MQFKSIVIIGLALSIEACGDSNEKSVGLFKYEARAGKEKIAEVKKDGDTYLFIEDAIRKSKPIALTKTADGLSFNNIPLKLSEDGDTLYFGPINGARVDSNYLSERLATVERNKKLCTELQEEVNGNQKAMPKEQWNEYIKSLKSRTPVDCRIVGADIRW